MRRGSSGIIGSNGGGYSKPPPAPIGHNGGGGRSRLHANDSNNSMCKDRFGSPRERSPNLSGSINSSPSHPVNREKSPNPTVQDLQDCSMCLSAYIQSVNTVCGTACRLSQCLSQIASDTTDVTPQWLFLIKDAADIWEGIARAVGVASSSAKTQILSLLQEALTNQSDYFEPTRRQEITKVIHSVLLTFLNLHYQFSLTVVERFSETLQYLKEESIFPNGVIHVNTHNPSEVGQCPVSPSQNSTRNNKPPMQPMMNQPPPEATLHYNMMGKLSSSNESILKEDTTWTYNSSPVANTSCQNFPSQPRNISPSFTAGLVANEFNTDATIRRWSMGSTTDGWTDKTCLSPYNLFANRRWSVPETNEDPHGMAYFSGLHPVYASSSSCSSHRSKGLGSSRGTRQANSVDSIGKSPQHSRSVTPEESRQSSATSEDIQNVVHLLSLPTFDSSRRNDNFDMLNDKCCDHSLKKSSFTSNNDECHQKKGAWQDKPDQFIGRDDGKGQICTALWPPTGNVPGVTLTECSGEEENQTLQGWSEEGCVSPTCNSFARDSPSRASWPATSSRLSGSNLSDREDCNFDSSGQESSWPPQPNLNFRRHSTDTPMFLPQQHTLTKTKSFDNLKKSSSNKEVIDSNIQNLIYMGSLMSNGQNSQYTLFSNNM